MTRDTETQVEASVEPDDHDDEREAPTSDAPERAASRQEAGEDSRKAASQRKERVLHTRVPAVLEMELKRLAESLRMPVSNVVRAILEDAVTAVDVVGRKAEGEMNRVVDRMAQKRQRLRDITSARAEGDVERAGTEADEGSVETVESSAGEQTAPADPLAGVIGFQPLLLASSASCSVCGKKLRAGTEAYVGVRDAPGPRVLIGPQCLPKPEEE